MLIYKKPLQGSSGLCGVKDECKAFAREFASIFLSGISSTHLMGNSSGGAASGTWDPNTEELPQYNTAHDHVASASEGM